METEAAKTGSGIVTMQPNLSSIGLSVSQFTCVNLFYPSLHSQNEVTCILRVDVNVNTYAALPDVTMEARAVGSSAEVQRGWSMLALLSRSHHFVLVAIETPGALGQP